MATDSLPFYSQEIYKDSKFTKIEIFNLTLFSDIINKVLLNNKYSIKQDEKLEMNYLIWKTFLKKNLTSHYQ